MTSSTTKTLSIVVSKEKFSQNATTFLEQQCDSRVAADDDERLHEVAGLPPQDQMRHDEVPEVRTERAEGADTCMPRLRISGVASTATCSTVPPNLLSKWTAIRTIPASHLPLSWTMATCSCFLATLKSGIGNRGMKFPGTAH